MAPNEFLYSIIAALTGAVGYFMSRILGSIDKLTDKIDRIGSDVSDMRPKVDILWERSSRAHKDTHKA
jgi:hypothetical protein